MYGEWYSTPNGNRCAWCAGSDTEPTDADDAELTLCRGHLAEWLGESLASLDAAENAAYADMAALGFFD